MPYTADKPRNPRSSEELRTAIPGWGVDLDPKDRPAYPKEVFNRNTGAHWTYPEEQPELWPREKSPEHAQLTPVFGTTQPLKGLSGAIRKAAYNLSEGRASHWLLLIFADRVDVMESRFTAIAKGRPDNPFTESGIMAEKHHHGIQSRVGQNRYDIRHQPIDYAMMVAPYALLGFAAYKFTKHVKTRRQERLLGRAW